jgi:predicted nucleic acid-binding protein
MTAEKVYVDPSALARLYIHQAGSKEMAAWRAKHRSPLCVTHHGRAEIINAICRAAFLGQLEADLLTATLADFNLDFTSGNLRQADILWRAALNRAAELSELHTPELGTRSLDVLHVACALELELSHFLTFDIRQSKLAAAAGLKVLRI